MDDRTYEDTLDLYFTFYSIIHRMYIFVPHGPSSAVKMTKLEVAPNSMSLEAFYIIYYIKNISQKRTV